MLKETRPHDYDAEFAFALAALDSVRRHGDTRG